MSVAGTRELGLLREIAQTLLVFRVTDQLFDEVARVARELLNAGGGAVMLRSDVGDFLQVKAADGMLAAARGRLLPIEGSLAGWVVAHGEPLCTDAMESDPRNHPVETLGPGLGMAVMVPLRARDAVVGAVAAVQRVGERRFGDADIQLLQTLGDQVAIGLDRAALLEDAQRKELAVEQTNRELVEATRLKSQFLANMSHELRTPLNAIIGFSDLMLTDEGLANEHRNEYLEAISRNGKHLLELITSVLDVSRLDAGRMPTRLAGVDLRDAVRDAVADTESLRTLKRQTCSLEVGEEPLEVFADQQKVRQVLFNYLSNASKFTPDGGEIGLSAVRTRVPLPVPSDRAGDVPRLDTRDAVWIAVRDTGVGIEQQDLERLFQPFSQVDASASRPQQGTGLGLALAKQLVELHGGTVGVESVPEQGSTFWFILPVEGPIRLPDRSPRD